MAESIKQRLGAMPTSPEVRELYQLLVAVQADLAALATQFNQLLTDYNAHVHGGVTAGAANTSNVADSTATSITLNTTA